MVRAIVFKHLSTLGVLLIAALPASQGALAHNAAKHPILLAATKATSTMAAKGSTTWSDANPPWGEGFQTRLNGCVDEAKFTNINNYRRLAGLGDTKYPVIALVKGNPFKRIKDDPHNKFVEDFYSQGMILQYGFNFPESIKSFLKVLTFDENTAMAYWGIALASSSNINSTATEACDELSDAAALQARTLAANQIGIRKYQDLFGAANLKHQFDYTKTFFKDPEKPDPTMPEDRADKDQYKNNMKALSKAYPEDLEAATLYANALLNINPWMWWYPENGDPLNMVKTPEAREALATLEEVLRKDPDNIGANHFYIHAIEESLESESGEPMAERLRHLAPSSGHLVHMTSHILQRIGDNAGSSAANYRAIQVDRALMAQLNAAVGPTAYDDAYPLHYLGHNIHFLTWTLSIEGRENDSLEMSRELIENTKIFGAKEWLCKNFENEIRTKRDYYLAASVYFAVRFRNWRALGENIEQSKTASNHISRICGWHDELEEHLITPASQGRIGDTNTDQDWNRIIPYSNLIRYYGNATQFYDMRKFVNSNMLYTENFWRNSAEVFGRDIDLKYGTNNAFALIRIANLTFFGHMYQACQNYKNQSDCNGIVKNHLGPQLLDIVEGKNVKTLYDDTRPFLDEPSSQTWIGLWEKAVDLQDALNYNEPPDWYYTSRESLGFAHLANAVAATNTTAKKAAARLAKGVFEEDLQLNRKSGRSLNGLKQTMEILGDDTDVVEAEFRKAWANANISADMNAPVDQDAPRP